MFLFLLVLGASSTVCVSDEIACDFLKPTCVCLCVVLVRLFEALFLCFEERRLPRSSKKKRALEQSIYETTHPKLFYFSCYFL